MEITYENVLSHYKDEIVLNDLAHNLNHVVDVYLRMVDMNRVLELGINQKMIILAAFLHDLKCHDDRKYHHETSAKYVLNCWHMSDCDDPFINQLTENEVNILVDAIIKHRASGNEVPVNGIAGLLYAADKDAPVLKDIVIRSYGYNNDPKHILSHMKEKFSSSGYIKYNEYYKRYYGLHAIDKLDSEISNLTIEKVKDIVTS